MRITPQPETRTLRWLLEQSAQRFGTNPAVGTLGAEPMNYAALNRKAEHMAELLRREGVRRGDRVAILGENSPNWVVAFFGIAYCGAVAVPILPDFHTSEVHHILRHAEVRAIFISERLFDKLEGLEIHGSPVRILLDTLQLLPDRTKKEHLKDWIRQGGRELDKLRAAALQMTGIDTEGKEDDLASIIYTSGTTGHSKGVILTHRNLVSNVMATLKIQDVTEHDRFLSILPLSHAYENTIGMLIPIMQGACIYYTERPPTPSVLLPAFREIRPTMMLSVPLVIEKIVKLRVFSKFTKNALLRRLYRIEGVRKKLHRAAGRKLMEAFGGEMRFFGIGGAPLSAEIERFLREAGFPYAIGYGLTETSPLVAGCSPDRTRYRSTGPPLPDVEVTIHDPDPETGCGEIFVRGENIMRGYYKDPERTTEVLTEDGWFRTGDLGMMDGDGYLYIKGRIKNVIIGPNGENIYPEEIESVINACEDVQESLVFEQGGKLVARVYLDYEKLEKEFPSHRLSETQIMERIADRLEAVRRCANGKLSALSRINAVVEQTEPFEKTPTKKIKRYLYVLPGDGT